MRARELLASYAYRTNVQWFFRKMAKDFIKKEYNTAKMPRCFIALDIPEDVRKEIIGIQQELWQTGLFRGKITEPENIHLTLKFLGEIEDAKAEEVEKLLSNVKVEPFEAEISEMGVFSPQYIRIIWLKMGNQEVLRLQKRIDDALEGLFLREARFMGHLTIARVKDVKDKKALLEYISKVKLPKMRFSVDSFELRESNLTSQGPIYKTLERFGKA